MKKIAIIAFFLLISLQGKAQFIAGAAFDIHYQSSSYKTTNPSKDASWGVSIAPQAGYMLNEKLMLGATLAFDWSHNLTESFSGGSGDDNVITNKFGWSVAPFARYRVAAYRRFGVWMDSHLYAGMNYPRTGEGAFKPSFQKQLTYGMQISPVVSFSVNEKTMVNFHVSILSAGFAGSRTWKTNGDLEDTAHFRMFTGKVSGIFNTMIQEGWYGFKISTIRKF